LPYLLCGGGLGLLSFDVLLLELWQKSVPRFVFQLFVFGEFALDHQGLDVVDRVHVVHAA